MGSSPYAARPRRRWRPWQAGERSRHYLKMSDRKADHEVLRFHAQSPVRRHRQYQIDGLAFSMVQHDVGIAEGEPVKTDDALPSRLVEFSVPPQRVPDPGRLSIEADIPGEIDVGHLNQRLDLNFDRQEMRNPPRDDIP